MSRRVYNQPFLNQSIAIRQEIQRFESVHPSIYAIYDLIEAIPDPLIQQQIREHVVCIEDSFVNSQEWTLSRAVPDLKLGILGTVNSGKSALVHRYLTGSYMQEESPEGGRFKKEVVIDGQSFLLLIRDEGGAPEMQFAHWCDAVIFVFSLENEASFSNIYSYYVKMAHYCDMSQIPMILVGTQDAISESNPRMIDDTRARKLANDLRKCTYYETCATYGLNVERVFQDACQKIVHQRLATLIPSPSPHPDSQPPPSRALVHQQSQHATSRSLQEHHSSGSSPMSGSLASSQLSGVHGRMVDVSPPIREASVKDAHRHVDKTDKRCREHREKAEKERTSAPGRLDPQQMQQLPGGPSQGHIHPLSSHNMHPGGHPSHPMAAVPVPCPLPPAPSDGHRMLPPPPIEMPMHGAVPQSMMTDGIPTPASTPLPQRRDKKVQKANSFSGAAGFFSRLRGLHNSDSSDHSSSVVSSPFLVSPPSVKEVLVEEPPSSPRESSPDTASSASVTPLLGRRGDQAPPHQQRSRFSMIVEKFDSLLRFQKQTPSPVQPPAALSGYARSSSLPVSPPLKEEALFEDPVEYNFIPERTPTNTPSASRKYFNQLPNVRVQQPKKEDAQSSDRQQKATKNGDAIGNVMGSGRTIPIKQGNLYKKSSKPLNREWKKKFVTLLEDGRLIYYPNLQDYMEDTRGKEINLINTTVKIPGQRPRGSRPQDGAHPVSNGKQPTMGTGNVKDMLAMFESGRDGAIGQRLAHCDDESVIITNNSATPDLIDSDFVGNEGSPSGTKVETPNVKKRHRRARSGVNKNLDASQDGDSDGYEFHIVSLDNRQWYFEAQSIDERDEWVQAIEQQILSSLQGIESTKSKRSTDPAVVQTIRAVKGNSVCCDCDAPNPDWASLNLGTLICIECSGIHRNLGTHLSRVRSLDLDEWSNELVLTMTSIGNALANSIWENNTKNRVKPTSTSSREERERWIRSKYDAKEFLPPPPYPDVPLVQQLIDAVARQNIYNTILVLAYIRPDQVNTPYSKTDTRTALHLAAALSNPVLLQLLLWYGADARILDHEKRDAHWYARFAGSHECVNVLRSHGYVTGEVRTLPRPPRGSQGLGDNFDALPNSVI